MISTRIPVLNIFPEDSKKSFLKSYPSTDTEPEADVENGKIQSYLLLSSKQSDQNNAFNNSLKDKRCTKNVFEDFIERIPSFEYDKNKIRKNQLKKRIKAKNKDNIQFSKIEMSNNRFLNYFEAFINIAQHCHKNNQKFSRDNCKEYLKDCYIIDFSHDHYIPITSQLMPKQFNKYYRLTQRELKYL